MGRQNTNASLERWEAEASQAPYRASIHGNAAWEIGRPSPDLIAASRVSPGGRLLLAFEHEALRDYFVEGHLDQGAQAEPEGAMRAAAAQPRPLPPPPPLTLDEAFERYRVARAAEKVINARLNAVFVAPAQAFLAEGRVTDALAVLRSLPDTHVRTMALFEFRKSGAWDPEALPWHAVDRAAYTPAQAEALRDWQRADQAQTAASQAMGDQLTPLVNRALQQGDRAALTALIERTPPSVERAFLVDALNYRMPAPPVSPAPTPRPRRSR